MHISAASAANLVILNAALDDGTDIADTLAQSNLDAGAAVSSYLGLSVEVSIDGASFDIHALGDDVYGADIGASIAIPIHATGDRDGRRPVVTIVLYARSQGAFVDMAADLGWLRRADLSNVVLDQHLAVARIPTGPSPLAQQSTVNQAIGVLIGCGCTPEEAEQKLASPSSQGVVDRLAAAHRILADLEERRSRPTP